MYICHINIELIPRLAYPRKKIYDSEFLVRTYAYTFCLAATPTIHVHIQGYMLQLLVLHTIVLCIESCSTSNLNT